MHGSVWMAALGGEVRHEEDLPGCCARTARSHEDAFECPDCGAMWQAARTVEPENDAFMRRDEEQQRGAA